MATLKSQLTELEGRISTLENFTGLIVHRRTQEAQKQQAEQDRIRHTRYGDLEGEAEPMRLMAGLAADMSDLKDLAMICGELRQAGFKTRRDKDFSQRDVVDILRPRGFRCPAYGYSLRPSDQGANQVAARDLLRRLPKPIAAAT